METIKEKIKLEGNVKYVYKQMGQAIFNHKMLEPGDNILVGVSGGADSLVLLKMLLMRRPRIVMKDFRLTVCFVDADFITMDKKVLFKYFDSLGIDYVIKPVSFSQNEDGVATVDIKDFPSEEIIDEKIGLKKHKLDHISKKKLGMGCFWCSWNRRKILFETARELKCNKVALGHNLDDVVETTLLNLCFNGNISTMKPRVELFNGDLTIIRPLAYLEKKVIFDCADKLGVPYIKYVCPFGKDSKRAAMKNIIEQLYAMNPDVKKNILNAPRRIKTEYI